MKRRYGKFYTLVGLGLTEECPRCKQKMDGFVSDTNSDDCCEYKCSNEKCGVVFEKLSLYVLK